MKKTHFKFLGTLAMALALTLAVAGCDNGSGDSGGGGSETDLVAKWYSTQEAANSGQGSSAAYEFTSDGKLLSMGSDTGMTYTASGGTITLKVAGSTIGTATYSISGTALTLSNTGATALVAGTYYKKAAS